MCLAVPGQIKDIKEGDPLNIVGIVDFSGIRKEINLAFCPEAKVGDFILAHVGLALSILDQEEAQKIMDNEILRSEG